MPFAFGCFRVLGGGVLRGFTRYSGGIWVLWGVKPWCVVPQIVPPSVPPSVPPVRFNPTFLTQKRPVLGRWLGSCTGRLSKV